MYWLPCRVMSRLLLSCLLLLQSACHSLPDRQRCPSRRKDATLWVVYRDWHEFTDRRRPFPALAVRGSVIGVAAQARRRARGSVGWGDGASTGKKQSAGTATGRCSFRTIPPAVHRLEPPTPCPRFPPTREPRSAW
ncbi:MAG: hypothetical protein IPG64_26080 [Haliea sp.]|nr:hypothetical protein [Haliea sp.]